MTMHPAIPHESKAVVVINKRGMVEIIWASNKQRIPLRLLSFSLFNPRVVWQLSPPPNPNKQHEDKHGF